MTTQSKSLSARDRLILAVDTSTIYEARRIIDELSDYVGVFKVGLQMLMNEGPQVLKVFQERELKVFFDGKFLDIPNTVAMATAAVTRLRVSMLTVHATGGMRMLEAAASAATQEAELAGFSAPVVLGVTVLTSISQMELNEELKVSGTVSDQVLHLASLCKRSGLTGIVASPEEVKQIRELVGNEMALVTPGVRPNWAGTNDQSRVMTPADAIKCGADYLVIGRPITAAKQPKDAAKRILEEMEQSLAAAS